MSDRSASASGLVRDLASRLAHFVGDGKPVRKMTRILRASAPSRTSGGREVRWLLFRAHPALQAVVSLLGAHALLVVARILLNRWDFSAELEWMEGGSLAHVARIARHDPLYVEPSAAWVPFIYHPFYYYAAWVSTWFVGLGLPALRLVSLFGYAATLYGLSRFTWDATHSRSATLMAPALYSATFELSGAWFDIARVDSFAQGLLMLGLLAVRGKSRCAQLGGAALFYLCFLTKQTTLLTFAPAVAWALIYRGRAARVAAVALASVSGLSVAWMQYSSGGWYWYYCVELPSSHPWRRDMLIDFWTIDLQPLWPVLLILVFTSGLAALRHDRLRVAWSEEATLAVAALLGALAASWSSRFHFGGYLNVLMPLFAGLALAVAVVVGRAPRVSRLASAGFLALVALQLWRLEYGPKPHMVTEDDRQAADQLRSVVAAIDGEVYSPIGSSFVTAAGKRAPPHAMAIADVLRGGPSEPRRLLLSAIEAAVSERRFAAILLGNEDAKGSTPELLEQGYRVAETVRGPAPRTGTKILVSRLLRPR